MLVDKLIKGKWYTSPEWNTRSYAKFERFKGKCDFWFSEKIYCDAYSVSSDCWTAHKSELQEVPLSEIEKYLPKEWWQSLERGDCVVHTKGKSSSYTKNFVYELRRDVNPTKGIESNCLETTLDDAGNNTNGYQPKFFRKATQQETDLYHRFGKPVHVDRIKDSTQKDDFWCIKITKENLDVVGRFYNKQAKTSVYTSGSQIGSYYASHNLGDARSILSGNCGADFVLYASSAKYPEITTKEFYEKIGHVPIEEKSSWCVKVTKENLEVVQKWYYNQGGKAKLCEDHVCGLNSSRSTRVYSYSSSGDTLGWKKVLTTEEFYKEIDHAFEHPKRWKVGDKITYRSREECGGEYQYGGLDQNGFVGTISKYREWESSKNCWCIIVSCDAASHAMLESEFREWDSPKRERPLSTSDGELAIFYGNPGRGKSTSILPEPKETTLKKEEPVMRFSKKKRSIKIK